ncbi:hypothetical protein ACHAWF_016011 [Thalassiosira exigua]
MLAPAPSSVCTMTLPLDDNISDIDGVTIVSTPDPSAAMARVIGEEGANDNVSIEMENVLVDNISACSSLPSLGIADLGNIPALSSTNNTELDFVQLDQGIANMDASPVELMRAFQTLINTSTNSEGCCHIRQLLTQLLKMADNRNTLVTKVRLIQSVARRYIAIKSYRRIKATLLIQSHFRRIRAVTKFKVQVKSMVVIQAAARRFLAARHVEDERSIKKQLDTAILDARESFKKAVISIKDPRDWKRFQSELAQLLEEVSTDAAELGFQTNKSLESTDTHVPNVSMEQDQIKQDHFLDSSSQRHEITPSNNKQMVKGKRHGPGTLRYENGTVSAMRYRNGEVIGRGVRWSADHRTAWVLKNVSGKHRILHKIRLIKAETLALKIGIPTVPICLGRE